MSRRAPTPPQTVGPFFHGGLLREGMNVMAAAHTAGERIRIEGQVLDGDGAPVTDAIVEVWQADAQGRYRHPADPRARSEETAFTGFGRCGTDDDGRYSFETIRPGAVPGPRRDQAQHVNVTVFARGLLHHLSTRLYFEDGPANETDPVLQRIPADRRGTLIAHRTGSGSPPTYRFDIVLQGPNETVFFSL